MDPITAKTEVLRYDELLSIGINEADPITFRVPKSTFASVSPVFRRMIENKTYLEGSTGIVKFPEDDEDAWRPFLAWLTTPYDEDFCTDMICQDTTKAMELIVFADKYNVQGLHQIAIRHLENTVGTLDHSLLEMAFTRTSLNNPVRDLLVKRLVEDRSFDLDECNKWDHLSCTGFHHTLQKHTLVRRESIYACRKRRKSQLGARQQYRRRGMVNASS